MHNMQIHTGTVHCNFKKLKSLWNKNECPKNLNNLTLFYLLWPQCSSVLNRNRSASDIEGKSHKASNAIYNNSHTKDYWQWPMWFLDLHCYSIASNEHWAPTYEVKKILNGFRWKKRRRNVSKEENLEEKSHSQVIFFVF